MRVSAHVPTKGAKMQFIFVFLRRPLAEEPGIDPRSVDVGYRWSLWHCDKFLCSTVIIAPPTPHTHTHTTHHTHTQPHTTHPDTHKHHKHTHTHHTHTHHTHTHHKHTHTTHTHHKHHTHTHTHHTPRHTHTTNTHTNHKHTHTPHTHILNVYHRRCITPANDGVVKQDTFLLLGRQGKSLRDGEM